MSRPCYSIPGQIRAGTTVRWLLTLTAYPAPDWTLTFVARGSGSIDLTSTASGAGHEFAVAASVTADWAPGRYSYEVRASDGDGIVATVEAGTLTVAPDLSAAADDFDGRTHAERVLDAIEAVIEGRASSDQERYTIGQRELWRTPIADLLTLRTRYREEVRQQRARAAGMGDLFGRIVRVGLN